MRSFLFLTVGVVVMLAVPFVGWAAPDYSSVKESYDAFGLFAGSIKGFLNILTGPGTNGDTISRMLFLTLAVYVFSVAVAKWMMKQTDVFDLLSAVLLIVVVSMIQTFYSTLMEVIHSLSSDLAATMQEPIVGTTDVLFAPMYIHNLMKNISFTPLDIFAAANSVVAIILASLAAAVLSAIAFFTVAWGTWGYAVATLIGWVFVPLLLVPRLSFLFDGWFRFMVGFLVYDVLARLQIALSLWLLTTYFGLPLASSTVAAPLVMPGVTLSEFSGFLVLVLVAIVGLIATGKFSIAIASGVGGAGGALARTALGTASAARAFAA